MSFFKKLSNLLIPKDKDTAGYLIFVQCNFCKEVIQARVNLYNDLSFQDTPRGKPGYYCRKVLVGNQRCFRSIDVEMWFTAKRQLIKYSVNGGKFISPEEAIGTAKS